MAAVTPDDIANMALGLLTEAPIESMDEDSRAARMLRLHYETTREAELTKSEWVFARKSMQVDGIETGDTEWPYAFELPEDCLRPLPPMLYGCEILYRQAGSTLAMAYGGTQTIHYIANLIDPNDWPAIFTDVLVAALAIKVAHAITGKPSMMQIAQQAYDRAYASAVRMNAVQKGTGRRATSWEDARAGRAAGFGFSRNRHGAGL